MNCDFLKPRAVVTAASMTVLLASTLGSTAALAAPVATAPAGVSVSAAALTVDDYSKVFSDITGTEQNVTETGELDRTRGVVIVGGKLHVPDNAKSGDSIRLTLSDEFRFVSFNDLEIKTADGTLIATASAISTRLAITFADAVDNLQNVSGDFNISIRGVHKFQETNTGTLDLIAPNGQALGPHTTHKMQETLPNATGMLLGNRIAKGNEIGITVNPQFSPASKATGPLDAKSVKFTVESQERDAVIDTNYAPTYRFIDADGLQMQVGDDGVAVSGPTIAKKITDHRWEFTLPADVKVPEGAVGVRLIGGYVVGKPSSDYHFALKIEAMGKIWIDTFQNQGADAYPYSVKSAKLDGAADGVIRNSKTTLTKKVTSNPDRILVGDVVTYTIETTNNESGRAALGIVTTDTLPKGVEFVSASNGGKLSNGKVTWPAVDIAGGNSAKYTVKVKVLDSAADLFTNKVSNVGENTCFEGDKDSICSADAKANVARPAVELDKEVLDVVDSNEDGFVGNAGDKILYGFKVSNKGNTTEKTVTLTDKLLGLESVKFSVGELKAGDSVVLKESKDGEFSYTITEDDSKVGNVHNVATVTIPDASDEDEVDEDVYHPDFEFTKNVAEVQDTNKNGVVGDLGDKIIYDFTVKNTGNADLEGVVLNDPLLGVEDLVCEFDEVLPGVDLNASQKPEGEEATGDETVAEALTANCSDEQFNHVITKEDVEAGEVVNVATAWAPGVDEKESTTTTEVQPAPVPSPEPSEEPTETPEPTPAPSEKPAGPKEEVLINTGLGAKKDSGNAAIIAGSAVLGAGAIGGGLWALLRKRKNV